MLFDVDVKSLNNITAAGRRIAGDLAGLRAARIASGGAGAPAVIHTGSAAVLGISCGGDRAFLNFSDEPVDMAIGVGGADRLIGAAVADRLTLAPWQVAWIAA